MSKMESSSGEEEDSTKHHAIYCSLCKMGFPSTVPYRQHLKGSNHQKAETKEFMKQKYGRKYLEELAKLQSGNADSTKDSTKSLREVVEKTGDDDDDAIVLTCGVCKKVCTGIITYDLHIKSNKHAKQVKKQQLIEKLKKVDGNVGGDETGDSLYDIVPELKPFTTCDVCRKPFNGPEAYLQHLTSETHSKELKQQKLLKEMKDKGMDLPKSDDDPFVVCYICDKSFSGIMPYQQHLQSNGHKNKFKTRDLAEKYKHCRLEDEESVFKCEECGKQFSGPKPLQQHLLGPEHSKQKRRDHTMQQLMSKHPEFVMEPNGDEDSDDDGAKFFLCTICHKSFSGVESATDHFISKKHLKTKKEKERIEKLLNEKKQVTQMQKKSTSSSSADEIPKQEKKRLDSDDFEVI